MAFPRTSSRLAFRQSARARISQGGSREAMFTRTGAFHTPSHSMPEEGSSDAPSNRNDITRKGLLEDSFRESLAQNTQSGERRRGLRGEKMWRREQLLDISSNSPRASASLSSEEGSRASSPFSQIAGSSTSNSSMQDNSVSLVTRKSPSIPTVPEILTNSNAVRSRRPNSQINGPEQILAGHSESDQTATCLRSPKESAGHMGLPASSGAKYGRLRRIESIMGNCDSSTWFTEGEELWTFFFRSSMSSASSPREESSRLIGFASPFTWLLCRLRERVAAWWMSSSKSHHSNSRSCFVPEQPTDDEVSLQKISRKTPIFAWLSGGMAFVTLSLSVLLFFLGWRGQGRVDEQVVEYNANMPFAPSSLLSYRLPTNFYHFTSPGRWSNKFTRRSGPPSSPGKCPFLGASDPPFKRSRRILQNSHAKYSSTIESTAYRQLLATSNETSGFTEPKHQDMHGQNAESSRKLGDSKKHDNIDIARDSGKDSQLTLQKDEKRVPPQMEKPVSDWPQEFDWATIALGATATVEPLTPVAPSGKSGWLSWAGKSVRRLASFGMPSYVINTAKGVFHKHKQRLFSSASGSRLSSSPEGDESHIAVTVESDVDTDLLPGSERDFLADLEERDFRENPALVILGDEATKREPNCWWLPEKAAAVTIKLGTSISVNQLTLEPINVRCRNAATDTSSACGLVQQYFFVHLLPSKGPCKETIWRPLSDGASGSPHSAESGSEVPIASFGPFEHTCSLRSSLQIRLDDTESIQGGRHEVEEREPARGFSEQGNRMQKVAQAMRNSDLDGEEVSAIWRLVDRAERWSESSPIRRILHESNVELGRPVPPSQRIVLEFFTTRREHFLCIPRVHVLGRPVSLVP